MKARPTITTSSVDNAGDSPYLPTRPPLLSRGEGRWPGPRRRPWPRPRRPARLDGRSRARSRAPTVAGPPAPRAAHQEQVDGVAPQRSTQAPGQDGVVVPAQIRLGAWVRGQRRVDHRNAGPDALAVELLGDPPRPAGVVLDGHQAEAAQRRALA